MNNICIGELNILHLFAYFFIYAFIGWIIEIIYACVNTGEIINRGFLTGPICPIYGVVAVGIIVIMTPYKKNIFLVFIFSAFITTLLELITGTILDYCFHKKWWNYENIPFNFHGYICVKFSIIWTLVCVFGLYIVQPIISFIVTRIAYDILLIMIIFLAFIMILDLTMVSIQIIKLNKKLRISEQDDLGKYTSQKNTKKINYTEGRIFRAFPNIKTSRYFRAFEDMKQKVTQKRGDENEE